MTPPTYTPPVDPTLEAQAQQAQTDKINALQQQLQGDTASVMQRYGSRVAMSGASFPSLTPSATTVTGGGILAPVVKALAPSILSGKL